MTEYLDQKKIRDLLYDDENFLLEFSEAATASFQEFSSHYEQHLLNRDEPDLRKAGHKIKPVALMMGVTEIVDEYEHAKNLLHKGASDKKLRDSVDTMNHIISRVIEELKNLTSD